MIPNMPQAPGVTDAVAEGLKSYPPIGFRTLKQNGKKKKIENAILEEIEVRLLPSKDLLQIDLLHAGLPDLK